MSKIVWFDSSNRREFLAEIFKDGDWIGSLETTLLDATHVCVHHTDFNDNHERLAALKKTIETISVNNIAPLILVYTGDPNVPRHSSAISRTVQYFQNLSLDVRPIYDVYQSSEGVAWLSTFLAAEKHETDDDIRKNYQQLQDKKCAIELAAEVVTWLRETHEKRTVPSTEMTAITNRLTTAFGPNGEELKKALKGKDMLEKLETKISDPSEANHRVEAWKRAGMLSTIKDKGET